MPAPEILAIQPPVTKIYMIGFVPRSGSTWLCQLLGSTGRLGNPREWFHERQLGLADEAFGSRREYIAHLLDHHSPGNVFGFKVTWEQLGRAVHCEGQELLFERPLTVFWLDREDREAQAISEYKALQSGRWHSPMEETASVAFSASHIREAIHVLDCGRKAFEEWFARVGIQPYRLTYENLASDPEGVVAQIAGVLGVDISGCKLSARNEKLADVEDFVWKVALDRAA